MRKDNYKRGTTTQESVKVVQEKITPERGRSKIINKKVILQGVQLKKLQRQIDKR